MLVAGAAVLAIGRRLGGLWRFSPLGIAGWLPRGPLDAAYDAGARARRHIFAHPEGGLSAATGRAARAVRMRRFRGERQTKVACA